MRYKKITDKLIIAHNSTNQAKPNYYNTELNSPQNPIKKLATNHAFPIYKTESL